jgi:4-aminobutyrate aminotransferase/(S)-3-amino-2-methylpropionate transaminase
MSCVAALAALETIEKDGLMERSTLIGKRFVERVNSWKKKFSLIGEVRALGGMCAFELVNDAATREPAGAETKELAKYAYEHGVITITAGTLGNVMRILVPLVVTDEQFDEAMDVLEAGLAHVSEKKQPVASHA